jgi:hypothetical protein
LQQLGALELRCLGQRRLEKLTHDSKGEIALQLSPPRPQHAHSALCSRGPRRREQRSLADPGRPLDDHERALARAGRGKHRLDPRQLLAPFEELSGGDGRFHIR